MNLRQLQHLIALADEGRFVAAAERVHLSQAAFSRSIQALEAHFGLQLFDRGAQGAALTQAGRTLVERARALVFDASCLERDAALIRDGGLGEVGFGAGPVPAAVLVPALLGRLRAESPGLVVRVRSGNVESLQTLLHAEAIDFCIADPRLLAADARLALEPVARIHGTLYMRPGHPLAGRRSIRPHELDTYGIGTVSTGAALRLHVARTLGFAGDPVFPIAVECDDLHALARLAQGGDMLALLPDRFVADHAPSLRPLALPGLREPLYADVHAIWLRGRTLSPAAERALRVCRQLAAEMLG